MIRGTLGAVPVPSMSPTTAVLSIPGEVVHPSASMPILPFKFPRLRFGGRSHLPINQDQYVENAVSPRSPVVMSYIHPELDRKFDLTSSVRCTDRSPIVYGYHADLWKGIWNGEVVAIKVIRVIGNSVDRKQACAKVSLCPTSDWSTFTDH